MHIIYFLLSIGAFLAAMFASLSPGGVAFMIIMSLLFVLIGTGSLLSSRLERRRRPDKHIISPEELRQYREQAEKMKQRKQDGSE
jgi:hypothetical protein